MAPAVSLLADMLLRAFSIQSLRPSSKGLARDLKQRGFSFCGPVISYAFAQAVGMVNDHLTVCFRHAECAKLAGPRPQKISRP